MRQYNPVNRSEDNPFKIQHDPLDYKKPCYLSPKRMSSYSYQLDLAVRTGGYTFLNIGSANNLINYLLSNLNKFVIDVDLDLRTKPTTVALLPSLPFTRDAFDVALCFQLLEHLPFSMFSDCLKELKRVSKKDIIISLPDRSLSKREKLKQIIYTKTQHPREWKQYNKRNIDIEHFWEISNKDITLNKLLAIFDNENLIVINHFRNNLNRYHHFFYLQK